MACAMSVRTRHIRTFTISCIFFLLLSFHSTANKLGNIGHCSCTHIEFVEYFFLYKMFLAVVVAIELKNVTKTVSIRNALCVQRTSYTVRGSYTIDICTVNRVSHVLSADSVEPTITCIAHNTHNTHTHMST